MRVLITGVSGFLGYSVAVRLIRLGHTVLGIDKSRDDRQDKSPRLQNLKKLSNFFLYECDLSNHGQTQTLFEVLDFDHVVHLAGQYSVAYSTKSLLSFIDGNIRSFLHVMDGAKQKGIKRVVYASSTFVQDGVLPTSMYGATLEFRERAARVYAEMGMETIGLRFGSTYGPYLRPDVGVAILARKLFSGEPIKMTEGGFNYTTGMVYVADAVDVVQLCLERPMTDHHRVFTVVAHDPVVGLGDILRLMEQYTGKTANRVGTEPIVPRGYTPTEKLQPMLDLLGYRPETTIEEGLKKFCDWYAGRVAAGKT